MISEPFKNKNKNDIILLLRPILILFVVLTHIPWTLYRVDLLDVDIDFPTIAWSLISGTVASAALPTLSLIAGYLAFYTYQKRGYLETITRKIRTLLLPMILWNLVMVGLLFWLASIGIQIRPDLKLHEGDTLSWVNALVGVSVLPVNAPLYFIRELILCFMFMPVLALVRSLPVAFAVVLSMAVATVLVVEPPFVFRIDIYMWFVAGYFAAQYRIDRMRMDKKAVVLFLSIFIFAAVMATILGMSDARQYYNNLQKVLNMFGPIVFFLIGSILLGTKVGGWLSLVSRYSYTLFLSHIFTITAFGGIWWYITGQSVSGGHTLVAIPLGLAIFTITIFAFHVYHAPWRHILQKDGRITGLFSRLRIGRLRG